MATYTKYNSFLKNQLNGTAVVDFEADTIKLALVSSSYTPNAATHDFFNDITNEVTGTNYTAGGATLGSKTLTESGGTATFDAADVVWAQSGTGFTGARYAILYKDTGVASTSPLIGYYGFVSDKDNVDDAFTFTFNASGIFSVA